MKNWLRISMGEEIKLTKLFTLSIERDLGNKIDGNVVLQTFAVTDRMCCLTLNRNYLL